MTLCVRERGRIAACSLWLWGRGERGCVSLRVCEGGHMSLCVCEGGMMRLLEDTQRQAKGGAGRQAHHTCIRGHTQRTRGGQAGPHTSPV